LNPELGFQSRRSYPTEDAKGNYLYVLDKDEERRDDETYIR